MVKEVKEGVFTIPHTVLIIAFVSALLLLAKWIWAVENGNLKKEDFEREKKETIERVERQIDMLSKDFKDLRQEVKESEERIIRAIRHR